MHVIKKLTLMLAWGAALPALAGSDKQLLTGGVTQLEGAAGWGPTPWAVIAGYGTCDQIGASASHRRGPRITGWLHGRRRRGACGIASNCPTPASASTPARWARTPAWERICLQL